MAALLKLSDEQLATLGAKNAEDFLQQVVNLVGENKRLKAEAKPNDNDGDDCPACDGSGDCAECDGSGKKMESKKSKKAHAHAHGAAAGLTAEEVRSLITESISNQFTRFAQGEDGKKIIGAQASKVAMEALAAVGTQPAKPSPEPGGGEDNSPQARASQLEAAGKFEEAFALLPVAEQRQFFDAKSYAAYRKAQARGQIDIRTSRKEFESGKN